MGPDSSPASSPLPGESRRGGERDERPEGGGGGNIALAAFALGLAGLAFLGGAAVVLTGVPPARFLKDAHAAALALHDSLTGYQDIYQTDLWNPARTPARGTTIHDPERAADGLTLYTSGHAAKAMLVAMDGRVVHEWSLPFSRVWDESAVVRAPKPDSHIYMRKAHLFPNGDLLAVYVGAGDSPWGYGLVRLNRDSEVVWKYLEQTHHDVAVGPDGRVYALTHEIRQNESEDYAHLTPPRIDDFLVELSPEGKELRKISLLDAFARSPWGRMLDRLPPGSYGDPLHTNAVDVIDAGTARAFPFAEPGQVLLSMREPGAIGILDLDAERFVWATNGPWVGQHDPDMLANGNILLFDNNGRFGPGGSSRVIEFDPATMEIVWRYQGSEETPFESALRAAQQRLPNGNTLITESDGGRLLEVEPGGEIVWEYVNPVRGGEGDAFVPVVSWAERFAPGDLDPEFTGTLDVNAEER